MDKFRRENEEFLDRTYQDFREEILDRLARRPNLFMDATFGINIHGGKISLQQSITCEGGRTYTVKTKP